MHFTTQGFTMGMQRGDRVVKLVDQLCLVFGNLADLGDRVKNLLRVAALGSLGIL